MIKHREAVMSLWLMLLTYILMVLLAAPVDQSTAQSTRVVVTAAHIDPDTFPAYKLLYADGERDIAYYVNTEYEPIELKQGSRVEITEELKGTAVKSEGDYFYVECDDPLMIVAGLSGKDVMHKRKPVGFVSSLEPGPLLRCVYY
jgi:hypothetical protein